MVVRIAKKGRKTILHKETYKSGNIKVNVHEILKVNINPFASSVSDCKGAPKKY